MRDWSGRRWAVAALSAAVTALVIAVPTDLIDTPLFSRDVPVTPWAWPALLVAAALSGLLLATYVAEPDRNRDAADGRAESRAGALGSLLSLLAVGCPVCNKIVLLALGTGGAMTWFAPAQPALAVVSIVLLGWALRRRLLNERACAVPARPVPAELPAPEPSDR